MVTTDRFTVTQKANGCILIMDTSRKDGTPGSMVAHVFQDPTNPEKAMRIATICAKHLNDEAARRAAKTTAQGAA